MADYEQQLAMEQEDRLNMGPETEEVEEEEGGTLGPCGCTDYHLADCPIVAPSYTEWDETPWYERDEEEGKWG